MPPRCSRFALRQATGWRHCKALRVPASRINDIVLERRAVSVDTAMRLVRYFGGDVQTWLNLQTAYDLKVAEKTIAAKIAKDIEPMAA